MTQSRKTQFVVRPAVTVAGLSILGVITLSALHEVSAPRVDASETEPAQIEETSAKPATKVTAEAATESAQKPETLEASTTPQPSTPEIKVAEKADKPVSAEKTQSQSFGDIILGDPDAPVTVIEYASMTCPHCARFHMNTLPKLKEKYVDTGKVKFIMRAYPLDNLAAAAFMLARCVETDKYYPFVDMLFEKQSQWARADDPAKELQKLTKLAGFTEKKFNQCISDQEALNYIQQVRDTGNQKYDIRSTPTLIVNGQKLEGNQPFEEIEALIQPLLKESEKS